MMPTDPHPITCRCDDCEHLEIVLTAETEAYEDRYEYDPDDETTPGADRDA